MVEVLKATTQNHAPLSQAQTVAVFQQLEDMNRATLMELHEMKREWEMSNSGIGDNKTNMRTNRAMIDSAQQELIKTNTRLSAMRVEILGNSANVVVLQEQAAKALAEVGQLREGQKVTNTNVHSVREDTLVVKEEVRKLQKEIASLKDAKENILQAKLDRVILSVQQFKEDLEANKALTFGNEDAHRHLSDTLAEAKADVRKLDIARAAHHQQLSELTVKGDNVKENLELTNGVVMRIHSEHEETRMKSIENSSKNHEVDVTVRRLQDDHNHIANSVQIVHEEMLKLAASQHTTRDKLFEATQRIGGLNSGVVNMQNVAHELGKNLEVVHHMASNTQDHLKMTNSLVLPNLGSDGAFCPSAVANGGGAAFAGANTVPSTRGTDMGNSRGSGRSWNSTRSTPRKGKDATWFARNIGNVPDRTAWT